LFIYEIMRIETRSKPKTYICGRSGPQAEEGSEKVVEESFQARGQVLVVRVEEKAPSVPEQINVQAMVVW
jgi:hypothetical protein